MPKNGKKVSGSFSVTHRHDHHLPVTGKKFEEQHKQYSQETENVLLQKKTNDEEIINGLVSKLREERAVIDESRKKEIQELDKKRYQGNEISGKFLIGKNYWIWIRDIMRKESNLRG
jgi:hypothetical protein